MMAAKHTPGPWHATPLRYVAGYADIGAENNTNVGVAYTEKNGGPSDREAMANARLIAAGPDLLAALVGLIDSSACLHPDEMDTAGLQALERARSAIAKATGDAA